MMHRTKHTGLYVLIMTVIICFSTGLVERTVAGPVWKVDITASYGDDSNRLILGAATDATDGFENAYEGRAILAGRLMAYFYHPEWNVDTPYFWSDIRAIDLPEEWVFYVTSDYTNKDIVLSWNIDVPDTVQLYLIDESSGTTIDMRASSSYTYRNTSQDARIFRVQVSGYVEVTPPQDTSAPDTEIVSAPDEFTSSSSVTISYRGSDDITPPEDLEFSYRMDEGEWSEWTDATTVSFDGLEEGEHTFSVRARDGAGNEDPSPSEVSFTVDTSPPVLRVRRPRPFVLWPPNSRMVEVTVRGKVSDDGSGVASLSYVLQDEYNQLNSSGTITPDEDGKFSFVVTLKAARNRKDRNGRRYLITVTAIDRAGNSTDRFTTVRVPRHPHHFKKFKWFEQRKKKRKED